MNDDEARLHKRTAVDLYNRVWELMEAEARTLDDDIEMVTAACASRYHWSIVGGPVQVATGDWQIARALALLGDGSAAIRFARAALERIRATDDAPDFMLASCYEGLARAHAAAAGDSPERDRNIALAREALDRIAEDDDRNEIARQIDSVPTA
ncbi:MAG TPA: hypothetical protein VGB52_11910 [Actinomycetota bacterium]